MANVVNSVSHSAQPQTEHENKPLSKNNSEIHSAYETLRMPTQESRGCSPCASCLDCTLTTSLSLLYREVIVFVGCWNWNTLPLSWTQTSRYVCCSQPC